MIEVLRASKRAGSICFFFGRWVIQEKHMAISFPKPSAVKTCSQMICSSKSHLKESLVAMQITKKYQFQCATNSPSTQHFAVKCYVTQAGLINSMSTCTNIPANISYLQQQIATTCFEKKFTESKRHKLKLRLPKIFELDEFSCQPPPRTEPEAQPVTRSSRVTLAVVQFSRPSLFPKGRRPSHSGLSKFHNFWDAVLLFTSQRSFSRIGVQNSKNTRNPNPKL